MKSRIALVIIFGVLFVGLGYPLSQKFGHTFKFVDEEEYIANGKLILQGYRFYQDVQTNHQPVPYFLSAAVQKFFPTTNSFMVIKRHRDFIFGWSVMWTLILVARFGWVMGPPLLFYELCKYFLIGNEFLAEPLVAYPVAYLVALTWELFTRKQVRDNLIFGLLMSLSVLTLLPLIVPLGVLLISRWFLATASQRGRIIFGLLLPWLGFAIPLNLIDYFRETWWNNGRYATPQLTPIHTAGDWVKLLTYNVWVLMGKNDLLAWWKRYTSLLWIGSFFILRKKHLVPMALLFGVWMFLNVRVAELDVYWFQAFHLLPWLLVGLVGGWLMLSLAPKPILILAFILPIPLILNPDSPFRQTKSNRDEHYVQYTPIDQASLVINTLKQPGDHLMVFPAEALLHWTTNLGPADKLVTHYEWQYLPPGNLERYSQSMDENPPEFIQFTDDHSSFTPSLKQHLNEKYVLLYRNIDVYLRKDLLTRISDEQWNHYQELPFEVIPKNTLL